MSSKRARASTLSPEYALLGLLDQQPTHGYELHQRLTSELGQIWKISLSQTYNILKRLEAHGFITSELQKQVGAPTRHHFHVTASGIQRFEDWLNMPTESSVRAIRIEFTTRLYFAYSKSKQKAHRLINDQIQEINTRVKNLKESLDQIPSNQTFNRLAFELRVRQLESIQSWLHECLNKLGI